MKHTSMMTPRRGIIAATAITMALIALMFLATPDIRASAEESETSCLEGGYNPTPTAVEITAVPISVASTTNEYFVLYADHDLDGANVEMPVLVKKGETGTTTLAENITGLPKESYRVEKYLISDPADVDGDCTDDITELDSLGSMNPANLAPAVGATDGATAIIDRATFDVLTRGDSGFAAGKFIIYGMDTDRLGIYFMHAETYEIHLEFLELVGLDQSQVIRGDLFYDSRLTNPDGSKGTYYFWMSLHDRSFTLVNRTYTLLAASMPLIDHDLAFHVKNFELGILQPDLPSYQASRMPMVFDADIYTGIEFQALNPGKGYGLLRTMDPDDRPHPRDVVIYETLPNELPRIAGIISTVPQTPLSHVNLRATQDEVPNAFIRNALDDTDVEALIGKYVRYEVTETGWSIDAATPNEVDDHYEFSRPTQDQTPQRDLSVTFITALSDVNFEDWTAFGVKAANVAELGRLGFTEGTVPDGFAIPFYFYDEFMKANGLDDDVDQMLADQEFQTDFGVQDDMLDDLRDDIKDAESPQWIIDALTEMHATYPDGQSLRYRSSTNNEDLPEFNGAGLYDSKTQDPDETEEDGIDKSIKGVFASLWTFRAFTEREFHRIDHTAAAMGVLVHPNYSDELANGVAVSFDPIAGRDSRYYVNTQIEEDLVTNPEAHSVPEEILVYQDGTYIVLATSNQAPSGKLLLSDTQLMQLSRHLTAIHDHFEGLYDPGTDEQFAMEIEFKITSANILAIKQARPWVFSQDSSDSPQALRISDAEADEGANVEFTVSMNKVTTDSVTVQYGTSDGTATGADYTPATGQTLTFAPGETEKTITIVTTDDSDEEGDESFQLVLSNPSVNAELSYSSTATGTIIDNDQPALSDDATLSALDLEDASNAPAVLTPQFTSRTTVYNASVANSVGYITITPTKNHTGASVSVAGPDGTATPDTATVSLDVGANPITAAVTAEDGTTTQTYVVTVTREASNDATLSGLSMGEDAATVLTPAFDPATTGYTAEVANTVESISLTAQANHDGASVSTVDADGASITDTARIDLGYGENIITVVVTAQDGATTLRYQVTITRAFAWHTTMTVGERLTAIPQASGYTTWGEDMGSLSTERMELNGTRYRVLSLMRYAGGLYLNINQTLPGDFTLTVGDQDFLASESAEPPTPAAGRYWWDASAISWAAGDQVEVSIVPVPGSESLPTRPLAPPIAQFKRVPESHEGSTKFTFKLDFTADVRISYRTLKDHAFQVTNGTVKKAKRTVEGSDMNWTITVKPDSQNDIEIRLPATQDCAATGAICTREGRMLFNTTAFTVSGPSTP